MADDEAQVLLAAKKLPLYERIEHKNWKVRSEAYDDVRAGCERAFSSSEPILDEAGKRSGIFYGIVYHLQGTHMQRNGQKMFSATPKSHYEVSSV